MADTTPDRQASELARGATSGIQATPLDTKAADTAKSTLSTVIEDIDANPWRRFAMWVLAVVMPVFSIVGFFVVANNPSRPLLGLAIAAAVVGAIGLGVLYLSIRLKQKRQAAEEEKERQAALFTTVRTAVGEALASLDASFERQLRQDPRIQWELAYEIMTARQTWGYANLEFSCERCDDGAAFFRRKVEVEVRGAASSVEQSLYSSPAEKEKRVEPKVTLSETRSNVQATMASPFTADNGWLTEIRFDPALGDRERTEFVLEEEVPAAYYAVGYTKEELDEQNITESYIGWRVDRPMRRLVLKVYFPVGSEPKELRPEVRIQLPFRGSEHPRRDPKEEERIGKDYLPEVRARRQEVNLTVSWPIVGRIYLIRWLPLDRPVPRE
jgi:hypothetical protein